MSMCAVKDCNLTAVEDCDKCVLHCEKSDYDPSNHIFREFYEEFIKHVVEITLPSERYGDKEEIIWAFKQPLIDNNQEIIDSY